MKKGNIELMLPATYQADDDVLTGDGKLSIYRELIEGDNGEQIEVLGMTFQLNGQVQFSRTFFIENEYCINQLKNFLKFKLKK